VAHCLTEEALADFLKLIVCKARYRTPYLMGKFIEDSVHGAYVVFKAGQLS